MATVTLPGSREARATAISFAVVTLAVMAQYFVAGREYVLDGLFLYAIALAFGFRMFPRPRGAACDSSPDAESVSTSAPGMRLGRSLVLLGTAIAANALALILFGANSAPNLAWLLYGLSVLGAPLSVWFISGRPRVRPFPSWGRAEFLVLAMILVVAAAFRLNRLDSLPTGVWWDEAAYGLQTLQIMADGNYRPVYVGGASQMPALLWYVMVPSFWVFGPTAMGLRMPSVVAGVLGVLAVYLLARELYGKRAAVAAAALLAVMAWHVNWSRIGMAGVWSVALDALAAYFVLKAVRSRSLIQFALAGTTLGLGLNMYFSSRLLIPVLLITLVHHLVRERLRFLKEYGLGLLVLLFTAVVTVSPLAQYAILHTSEFNMRTDTVSIFKELDETHSLTPLVENARKHLLMFHFQGDNNGRHNLPGAPMLDPITGALLAIGLIMAIRRLWMPAELFLLSWAAIMLAGGVFSLSFEAPQGYRTIDAVTAVSILAALPLASLWDQVSVLGLGRFKLGLSGMPFGTREMAVPLAGLGVLAALVPTTGLNYDRYFLRQASDTASWAAFSTAETEVARQINSLGPDYDSYLGETYLGHPTIAFLTGRKEFQRFDPVNQLPVRGGRGVALFLEPQQSQSLAILRRLYPQAEVRAFRPPGGGPVVMHSVILQKADVASLRGLPVSYYESATEKTKPVALGRIATGQIDWGPAGAPAAADFAMITGILAAPEYGSYLFKLEGTSQSSMLIDGWELNGGEEREIVLAKGNHSLSVGTAVDRSAPLRLLWKVPGTTPLVPVPASALFAPPASNHGLLGSYYRNTEWAGPPAFQQIDPHLDIRIHLLPLPRPYSVEWVGKIDVPADGLYRFSTESADTSWIYVDGSLVASNLGASRQSREGSISLAEGFHDIRIRFQDITSHTFIRVSWTPPGGSRELLPSSRLYPPMTVYPPHEGAALSLPPDEAASPVQQPPSARQSNATRPIFDLKSTIPGGESRLVDPRDMVAGQDDRLYVIETAAKRVRQFRPDGTAVGQAAVEFEEPFGIALGPDGSLFVVDSLAKEPIVVLEPGGRVLRRVGGAAGTYRPRGIFVDSSGAVYLADTGRGRVVKLTGSGQVLGEYRAGGQMGQPVSLAVASDGTMYVVDAGKQQIWVLDNGDKVLQQWQIAASNTFDAPHVALGAGGEVFISEPGLGTIRAYDSAGTVLGQIGAPGSGDGELKLPTGLKLDSRGRLWVADTLNGRVQQWGVR